MALNIRQQRRYTRTLDIWRPTPSPTAATTYTRTAVNVPYGALYTPNIDQPSDLGAFKMFTLLVLDGIHLEASVDLRDNDAIVDTTILPNGNRSALYGTGGRLRGASQMGETTRTVRNTNKQTFKAMSIDHLPPDISAQYT